MNQPSQEPIPKKDSEIKISLLSAALLVVGSILLCIIAFEVIVRFSGLGEPRQESWNDRPTIYYLPERPKTEEQEESFQKKQPNEYRIVVIGDSFTFGQDMQLTDAFPAKLEHYLNLNLSQRPVKVLNLGRRGLSTRQEVEILLRSIKDLSPDLVIHEFTLNDPELTPYRVSHPYLDEYGHVKLTSPIFHYWKGLTLIVSAVLNAKLAREYDQYYFDIFANEENWGGVTRSMELLKKTLDASHIPLTSVIFPLFNHPLDESYPFQPLHLKTYKFLHELGVPTLDLLRYYKGIPPERLQIRPGVDSHPNEIAHRIAADAILSFLRRSRLLPTGIFPKHIEPKRL